MKPPPLPSESNGWNGAIAVAADEPTAFTATENVRHIFATTPYLQTV